MSKPTEMVKDEKYPEMYRLKWADGVLSADFYNLTRAKDILKNYDFYRNNMKQRENMSEDQPQDASPAPREAH